MKINAIQCKKCLDIIYSRNQHDYRKCSCLDDYVAIDGGNEYCKIVGNNFNRLALDGDYLLKFILTQDWKNENNNANNYPNGYHGKFEINVFSNKDFFNDLVILGDVIYDKEIL